MPRKPRIQYEGATYHVFSRGNRRERIFRQEEDFSRFEDIMLEAMRWSGVHLMNWSQMPNHFHFNVETPEGNIAEFMQRVQSRFAKYFNGAHRLVGHVFQGRYGSRLVDAEAYAQEIIRYVELNAYRTKKRALAKLGEWKWASLRYLLQPEERWPEGCQAAFRKVLGRFGNEAEVSRRNLATFLADGLESGTWEDFYNVKDGRFVGDNAFIERIKRQEEEAVRSSTRLILPRMEFRDILRRVEETSGLTMAELSGGGQVRRTSRWRQALAYVARRFYRVPTVKIASALGRDATTISHMIERIRGKESGISEINQFLKVLQAGIAGQSL